MPTIALPANLAAADSPDLIAAALRDGDALHRELAARLSLAEKLADRIGSGAEFRAMAARLARALREVHELRAALVSVRTSVAAGLVAVRTAIDRRALRTVDDLIGDGHEPDDAAYFAHNVRQAIPVVAP